VLFFSHSLISILVWIWDSLFSFRFYWSHLFHSDPCRLVSSPCRSVSPLVAQCAKCCFCFCPVRSHSCLSQVPFSSRTELLCLLWFLVRDQVLGSSFVRIQVAAIPFIDFGPLLVLHLGLVAGSSASAQEPQGTDWFFSSRAVSGPFLSRCWVQRAQISSFALPMWQNHLRNEGSVFQDPDQMILDEARMHVNTHT
jgi:hypothetical protein